VLERKLAGLEVNLKIEVGEEVNLKIEVGEEVGLTVEVEEVDLKIEVVEEADLKRFGALLFRFLCLFHLFQKVLFPCQSDLPKAASFSLSLLATRPRPSRFRSHLSRPRLRQSIGVYVSALCVLQHGA
jgi:hypothetical protein